MLTEAQARVGQFAFGAAPRMSAALFGMRREVGWGAPRLFDDGAFAAGDHVGVAASPSGCSGEGTASTDLANYVGRIRAGGACCDECADHDPCGSAPASGPRWMPVDGTFRTATDSAKVARGPSRGCGGISAVGAATNRAELATEMGLALWGEIHALGADRGSARHQSRMPTVSPASPDCSSMAWFYDPPEVLRAGLGSVGYDGGLDVADCSEGLDEVIRLAWAMLRANPDIIRWAGAVVLFEGGYLRHGERLDALLDEMATDVFGFTDVQCVGTSDPACKAQPGGIPQMFTTRYTGPIHVCSGASPSWEAIFRCGNRADKLGAIIDMARLLAHEITHLLGLAPGDNPGNCEVSFLFGNTVGWALGERYAKAKEGCFGNFWNEGSFNFLFMNDAEFLSDPPGPGSCPTSCAADTDTDGPVLGVLRYAGGGWDTQICILCPEACAGDQPVKGGPEADVWEDCLGAIAEAVLEETDTSTPLAKM